VIIIEDAYAPMELIAVALKRASDLAFSL